VADVPAVRLVASLSTSLAVACPHCPGSVRESTWVHPRRVEVDRMGDVVEVAPDGVGFATRPESENDRVGTVIRLEFWCESGHQFAWQVSFEGAATLFRLDAAMPGFDITEYMDELPRL